MKSVDFQRRLRKLFICLALSLGFVSMRIGWLTTVKHRDCLSQAINPSLRTELIPTPRGEIVDRYGVCLARNKTVYQAGILYSEIAALPKSAVVDGEKQALRARYVEKLSHFLSRELNSDSGKIEDAIYARAALSPSSTYFFDQKLTEKQFARLNARTAKWPGLVVQQRWERHYPLEKIGGSLIGYTSVIDQAEWENYGREIQQLRNFIHMHSHGLPVELPEGYESIESVKSRLRFIEGKVSDFKELVGKTGLEKQYNEILRGNPGRLITQTNAAGQPLRISPRSKRGERGASIQLSLSAKLQEHCENLLIEHERLRRGTSYFYDKTTGERKPLGEPWIKGGAIAVLDAKDGSVLSLASLPRFNPNDFVNKENNNYTQWLETPQFLANLWNQQVPLSYEMWSGTNVCTESLFLTWDFFLHLILPQNHPVRLALHSISDITPIGAALQHPETGVVLRGLSEAIPAPYDKALFLDLLNLGIDAKHFTPDLITNLPRRSLSKHFKDKGHFKRIQTFVKEQCKEICHDTLFAQFRAGQGKSYLKEMRKKEISSGSPARPYTYYFLKKEQELFDVFWNENKATLCTRFIQGKLKELPNSPFTEHLRLWETELQAGAHSALDLQISWRALNQFLCSLPTPLAIQYTNTLTAFEDIQDRPLIGYYPHLRRQTAGGLALAFYPKYGFGYLHNRTYQLPTVPGSIFKLVPAYSALMVNYAQGKETLNPLTIIDEWGTDNKTHKILSVAKGVKGAVYPRWYKGGVLPHSALKSIGKIDLKRAIATTSNPYFAILCADILPSPTALTDSARELGFGMPTGIDLPYESSGFVPCDITVNRSGLYALAIGQHTATATPLQVAQMLRRIVSKEPVTAPHIGERVIAGSTATPWLHKTLLMEGGIDFPLFYAREHRFQLPRPKSNQTSSMPEPVQKELVRCMRAVVSTAEGTAHPSHGRLLGKNTSAYKSYMKLFSCIAGKTSTAEIAETHSLDNAQKNAIYNNTWFGGISYLNDEPELIVVVFLPYGTGGKEAAPLMASVVDTYRELELYQ